MLLSLLYLPPHLLLLITTVATAQDLQWPYNLPKHQKHWPEHEHLVKRHAQVQAQLATAKPVGVRKMSDDPSEMFFLDYWQFNPLEDVEALLVEPSTTEDDGTQYSSNALDRRRLSLVTVSDDPADTNATYLSTPYLPPIRLVSGPSDTPPTNLLLPRDPLLLFKRDFTCPTNTNSCTSIGRPNSCCGTSETCTLISDSGIGDVGCCPAGQKCSGSIGQCNTAQGYTSCPGSPNGGCCIPGFTCQGVGCIAGGGSSTTTTSSVVTVTNTRTSGSPPPPVPPPPPPPSSSVPPVTTTSTIVASPIQPSTTTVFTTITPTATEPAVIVTANTVSASTPSQSGMTCSPGFNTCAASLGGGCCPTDRACGSGGVCPPLSTSTSTASTSAAAAPPIRPTSESSATPSSVLTTTTSSMAMCPTGYYMCSATYIGGCCQVGRNCDTTDCPVSTTATVVNGGATIIVPGAGAPTTLNSGSSASGSTRATGTVSAASATTSGGPGQCAQGFLMCPMNEGGGCCPSGYGCGGSRQAQCTADNGAGSGTVGKAEAASAAAVEVVRWGMLVAGVGTGVLAWLL